jgi:hypothetical protein
LNLRSGPIFKITMKAVTLLSILNSANSYSKKNTL